MQDHKQASASAIVRKCQWPQITIVERCFSAVVLLLSLADIVGPVNLVRLIGLVSAAAANSFRTSYADNSILNTQWGRPSNTSCYS
jgi:hypothetical protein